MIKIHNLYKKIFLLILGTFLIVVPFYSGSLNMLLLSDNKNEWTYVNWIFLFIGIVFFVGGWAFNSLVRIILKFISLIVKK